MQAAVPVGNQRRHRVGDLAQKVFAAGVAGRQLISLVPCGQQLCFVAGALVGHKQHPVVAVLLRVGVALAVHQHRQWRAIGVCQLQPDLKYRAVTPQHRPDVGLQEDTAGQREQPFHRLLQPVVLAAASQLQGLVVDR